MTFVLWGIAGLLAGWQMGTRIGGFGYGRVMDGVMGIAGGMIGGFAVSASPWAQTHLLIIPLLGAVVGGILATGFIGFASGRRRYA